MKNDYNVNKTNQEQVQIVGNMRIKRNAERLTQMVMSDLLEDTVYLLNNDEKARKSRAPMGLIQFENIDAVLAKTLKTLDALEENNNRVRQLLAKPPIVSGKIVPPILHCPSLEVRCPIMLLIVPYSDVRC